MASVPIVTLDKIDLVVNAVADRLLLVAARDDLDCGDVAGAFRSFAEGVAMLIGPVPTPEVENAGTQKTD